MNIAPRYTRERREIERRQRTQTMTRAACYIFAILGAACLGLTLAHTALKTALNVPDALDHYQRSITGN